MTIAILKLLKELEDYITKNNQNLSHGAVATFSDVKPVAEALLYSKFLPSITSNLSAVETCHDHQGHM
ncbi:MULTISPECIES: hypothetical protein [unclassified Acinetobacter]|jgi:hypothetical protein|uniref:hypothetical protein n=1 Tax=unclassified Acinetobacter TaxID=196816 RepID=UPI0018A97246|nr:MULTISPECIES: hypothetical protein [unclassified Acinetobacter]MBJ9953903.1 hypothetical protein [Acinetobacter baumannii]